MKKALVSVDMDLTSGIALRYAYQLANLIRIKLGTIHVEKPDTKENVPSTGWLRNRWEYALMQKEQEEIAALLNTPELYSPFLWNRPIVAVGDRDQEILNHLKEGFYDLFIEGRLATYSISKFYKIITSPLYQNLTTPVIMVKNLAEIRDVLILLDHDVETIWVTSQFFKIFGKVEIDVDLIYYISGDSEDLTAAEERQGSTALTKAQELLETFGLSVRMSQIAKAPPLQTSRYLQHYGMVISSFRWPIDREKPLVELLGRVLCPIFISWQ